MADVESWRSTQRRLRDRFKRSTDGSGPSTSAVADTRGPRAPDLRHAPIASSPGLRGSAVVTAKRTLRKLLDPLVLVPQTQFNNDVAAALRAQAAQIEALLERLDRPEPPVPFDYLAFEDRYRGESEAIARRQSVYADFFAGRTDVLDIGCGRGELLELLRERGIGSRGVDMDAAMVETCRRRGLDVTRSDALAYLEEQPDGAFDGVFLGQVVEHLTTHDLMRLLTAIAAKTRPGGLFIAETINPESLPVLTRWFWLDPTHVRLLHPETLGFMAEQAGFTLKSVQYKQPVPREEQLPALTLPGADEDVLRDYNAAVERVNQRLFGPLDYFILAKR